MPGPSKISLCFRLDDPHARSDHVLESAVFALFARHTMPLCVAVVPFYPMGSSGRLIGACQENMPHVADGLRLNRIQLAQHGYSHRNIAGMSSKQPSEFIGIDKDTQLTLITDGRRQLEEGFATSISGFVPPWNMYDRNTIQALEEARFSFISAGLTAPKDPMNAKPMTSLLTVPLTCYLPTLKSSIEQALRFQSSSVAIICVFHPDEFEEFLHPPSPGEALPSMNLRRLDDNLAWVSSVSEVSVRSIGELAAEARRSGRLIHISDAWWYPFVPRRYHYRLPDSILFQSNSMRLLPGIVRRVSLPIAGERALTS